MKKNILLVFFISLSAYSFAQNDFWKFENEQTVQKLSTDRLIKPSVYQTVSLSFDKFKSFLSASPLEFKQEATAGLEIQIPYPDKSFKRFKISETKVMEDGLATRFPGIKTFTGQGIDDPSATIRIDYTYQGFHAYVLTPSETVFIDPYQRGNNNLYMSYFSKDYTNKEKEKFTCYTEDVANRGLDINSVETGTCVGTQLRTYRLALSCTGEYAIAVCPAGNVTVANTLSAIVTTINRVDGVYEKELAIRLTLIANENLIIYTNPATDPYTGNNDGSTLLDESQSNITAVIGSANFDVGHTFSTGAGGIANIGVACINGQKCRGVTGSTNPTGDSYDIDYVSHEIGHEFGANHPFESETSFCGGGNRHAATAYEVGSGTTIMSYTGLCGTDNIQPHSDPYFHTKNFDEIIAYVTTGSGSSCPVITNTNNHSPVITMPVSGIQIPNQTPFTLTGSATDADGDALTYSWEEWDISNSGTGTAWNAGATSTVVPLFKSRIPKTSPSRTFPDIAVILAGYPANPPAVMNGLKGETLPKIARDIKFRLTVRDNKTGGGGVATGGSGCSSTAAFKVTVTGDGPFAVTSPNTAVTWVGGTTKTVTWNVANTNNVSTINCQNVNILMSTDGGFTFPIVVLANTPNDGTQNIIVPNIPTNTTVRFMVKAADNIFFDISDVNFTITTGVLPVSLINFSAKAQDNNVLVTWSTVTEINTQGFQVLRSDGTDINFMPIGFVNGAGNSSGQINYSFTDNNVIKGIEYFYKLKQVDLDSNYTYSDTQRAELGNDEKLMLSIKPQPFKNDGVLKLSGLHKNNFTILISDASGKIVLKKEIANTTENTEISLGLNNKLAGVYIVKVLQDGIVKTIKAVKF